MKIYYNEEAKVWVGYDKKTNTYSQGKTAVDALVAVKGAIKLKEEWIKKLKK